MNGQRNAVPALLIRVGAAFLIIASVMWLLGMIALLSLSSGLAFLLQWIPFLGAVLGFVSLLITLGVFASIVGILTGYFFFRASYEAESGFSRTRRDLLLLVAILVLVLSLVAQAWFSLIGALLIMTGLLMTKTDVSFQRETGSGFSRG